jgi:RHH-type proline utilization regulon transcriptional repressor/proline dehydrogenase/delta 1-pyrroline-5-carboxylate dehydrogenase
MNPTASAASSLEQRTHQIGDDLLRQSRRAGKSFFGATSWSDRLMEWATSDEQFKVQLFRFVDVFPMLRTSKQVYGHLMEYLSQPGVRGPRGMGLLLSAGGLLKPVTAEFISRQVRVMARRFIAGEDAASALPTLHKLWQHGAAFSVDLLGESCVSAAEAQAYSKRYLDLITTLPRHVAGFAPNERLESDHLGPIPRTNVSIKITSLDAHPQPMDFERTLARLAAALTPILETAKNEGVFVNFDMEQFRHKDLTIALFQRCCETVGFHAGLAMQAYLKSGDGDAARMIEWAKKSGRQVTVRLVKGAYWDYETIHAQQQGWLVPVWPTKEETDACFERMTDAFVAAIPTRQGEGGVKLALGSHNVRSIAHALAAIEARGLPPAALELQMLHGMAGQLKDAVIRRDLRLREYLPVGQTIPGMAYLVRRLLENTSNNSWLKSSFFDHATSEKLLAAPRGEPVKWRPAELKSRLNDLAHRQQLSRAANGVGDGRPFITEPPRDFADEKQRTRFAAAVRGAVVPTVANDSTIEQARAAVAAAHDAFTTWRDVNPVERAGVLTRAASIMRQRRDELCGIVLREAGKPWKEADGDVCEAIDFCEYYARMAIGLFEPHRLGRYIGELNEQWYQPRGVAVVISPWNFPLAICCGMAVAALVTGNTVIVKPAEQTPGIAKVMCDILWQAGAPREVLHFVAGEGETVGAALVRDERVAIIAFTGSKAVGLDIIAAAGVTPENQPHVKKVICEMGGKNAIIVDSSADLDEAVVGVRDSAFGYAGQKCSACSRAIVLADTHDVFVERLVEATRALTVGDPVSPGTDVGPVIDEQAAARIRQYIEIGRSEGHLVIGEGPAAQASPRFIAPHIFTGITPSHRLATEEIFGPVLAVIKAEDFDEALRIANGSQYKLTGGLFTRTPSHLAKARRQFRVGNLYINRGCTGALVARQPFGGFGMSGVGSKAGGADYLLQFVEPRAVCENTLRRGFAPGL